MASRSAPAVPSGLAFPENVWKCIFSLFVRSLDGVSTIRKIGLATKALRNLVDSDAELWQTAWDESGFTIESIADQKDASPRAKYAQAARAARALRSPQRWQMHSLLNADSGTIKAVAFNEATLVSASTGSGVTFFDLKRWPQVDSTSIKGEASMNWTPMSSEWACDCEPSADSVAGFLHIPTAVSQSSGDVTVEKRGITAPYKDSHYSLVMIPNRDGRYPFALVTSKDDPNRPMWVYNLQTKRYTHQFTLNVPRNGDTEDEIFFNGNWLLINNKGADRGFKLFYIHYWDFGNFASAEELMAKSVASHNLTNLVVYTSHKPRFVAVERNESASSYSIVDVELWGLNNWNFDSKVTEARAAAIRVPCGSGKSAGCSEILSLTACANMIFMTDKDHLYVVDIESRCLVATLKLKLQDQSTQVAIVDSTLFVINSSQGVIAVDLLARSSASTVAPEKVPFVFSASDKLEAEKAALQAETARKEAEVAAVATKAAAEKKAQEEAAAAKAAAERKAQEDAAAAQAAAEKKAREEAEAAAAKAKKEAEERAAAAEAQAKKEAEEKAVAEAKKAQEEAAAAEKRAREEAEAKAAAELKAKREAEMAVMEAKEREAAEARAREEDAAAAAAKKARDEAEAKAAAEAAAAAAAEAQAKKEAEERAAAEKKAREEAEAAAAAAAEAKAKKEAEEAAAAKAAAEKKAQAEAEAQAKEKAAHEAAARALAEKKAFEEAEAAKHAENVSKAKSFRSLGTAVAFTQAAGAAANASRTLPRTNSVSALQNRSTSGAVLAQTFDLGDLDVSDPANGTVAYSELVHKPEHLDRTKLESYLSDAAFKVVFGMTRSEFASMPKWKQDKAKRERDLF